MARRGRLREAADEEDGGGRKHGAVEVDEPTLPALRRLYLLWPISLDLLLQRLRPLVPGLTHVRLSELLASRIRLQHGLRAALRAR